MEKQQIIQLLSGAAGSVGFGLIFNLRKKYLPLVAAGGFLGWLVYLLCSRYIWEGVFLPTLAASFATAIFAEVLATRLRLPRAWRLPGHCATSRERSGRPAEPGAPGNRWNRNIQINGGWTDE